MALKMEQGLGSDIADLGDFNGKKLVATGSETLDIIEIRGQVCTGERVPQVLVAFELFVRHVLSPLTQGHIIICSDSGTAARPYIAIVKKRSDHTARMSLMETSCISRLG